MFRNNIKGAPFLPIKYVVGYFFEQLSLGISVDISYEYPLQPHQMTTNYVLLLETDR
jgi:hypothetical protein